MQLLKKSKGIKERLIIIMLITSILILLGITGSVYHVIKKKADQENKVELQRMVEEKMGTLNYYHQLEEKGELSREEAQKKAKAIIKNSTYGEKGQDYFWVINNDAEMIMHPLRPSLNGEDVSGVEDPHGVNIFSKMITTVNLNGEGFVNYDWQYYDNQEQIEHKLSYVKEFGPWNWILGTGIYTNNENAKVIDVLEEIILISLIILIVVNLIIYYIVNQAIKPINQLTEQVAQFDIDSLDTFDSNFIETKFNEIDLLVDKYQEMINLIQDHIEDKQERNWLIEQQNILNNDLQQIDNLQEFSKQAITKLSKQVDGKIGTFYVPQEDEEMTSYKLFASYAYTRRKELANKFKAGEGLVGQVALEKEMIVITEVPDDYIAVNSSLGKQQPASIVLLPCVYKGEVQAIIEIGSLTEFTDLELEFLEESSNTIAISIASLINYSKMEELLAKTEEQKEELQAQQEELRVNNEELEEKTSELKESKSELQAQQEELRVNNEELKEKSEELETQAVELEEKNKELEQKKKEIKEKMKEVKKANKYKSEFLANMSHELRTPLNSILILSELLENNANGNLNEKEMEFAETINSSGADLLELINDILDLSKVEAGKMKIEIKKVNLDQLMTDMKQLFEQMAEEQNLDFEIKADQKLPEYIKTDKQKLEQIVRNLLSNAFKFTETGKVKLQVSRIEDKQIAFSVSDTGVGISADKKKDIFAAFQQEDGATTRKFGGTGLGLSISKRYSELLGGELKVESTKGEGSTFTLYLPDDLEEQSAEELQSNVEEKVEVENKTEAKEKEKEDLMSNEEQLNNDYLLDDREELEENEKSLLIIEDDPNFAKTLADLSREKGFKVLIAETGEDGLYLADYYLPNAIVLDVGLPGIDGWEVKERLQSNPRTKNILLEMISAADRDAEKSLQGVLNYLKKPVSVTELEQVLNEIEIEQTVHKLLVVEDNDAQRKSIVEYITTKNKDLEVEAASNGQQAYQSLQAEEFDLIVLDLGLENIDKFELLEKLKENKETAKIPIVVYTGEDLSQDEEIKLRKYVENIIVKEGKSSQRLVDEINIFLHKVNQANGQQESQFNKEEEEYLKGKKILLVDDDMRNVFALSSILEEEELDVVIGANGREAIEKLDANQDTDLVIMDIMMPEMDGYEAIKRIKEQERYQDLPIIALTAKAMKKDKEKCIAAGADDYLAKPLEKEKLFSLLRVWLQR